MRKGKMNPIKWVQEYIADNGAVFERLAKKTNDRGLEAAWNFTRNSWGAAQYLIGNGDAQKGIKSLKSIFDAVQKNGASAAFSDYLAHGRNLDSMSMRVRFGLPVNQSAMGRSAADSIEARYKMDQEHPEFKALAEDVYAVSPLVRFWLMSRPCLKSMRLTPLMIPSSTWSYRSISKAVRGASCSPLFCLFRVHFF